MIHPLIIGIDIGGTKIRLGSAAANKPEQLLYTVTIPTPRSFHLAQPDILQAITVLLDGSAPAAIGIASPGPIDRKRGTIGHPTNLHWSQAPIVSWLSTQYSCPIQLWNDTTAASICEAQFGAARSHRYALYVSVSTGIGTALTLDGWPLPGPHNQEGGRMILGTTPASPTFEQIGSGTAIVKRYGHIAAKITRASEWREVADHLALGLHNLLVATDPEIVVLGGGVSVHHKKFFPTLKQSLKRLDPLYPPPPIVAAQYIEHAPLIGVIAAVRHHSGLA